MSDERWNAVDRAWSHFFWTGVGILVFAGLTPLFVLAAWWVFG